MTQARISWRFESSVKEKDHQTLTQKTVSFSMFESSVKEKDHQTGEKDNIRLPVFESSVKEKDHQTTLWVLRG